MTKKAVIVVGGIQHIVKKDDEIVVDTVGDQKTLSLEPLMVFDEKDVKIGNPTVAGAKVTAEVLESDKKGKKVMVLKFQAKKRVKKQHGHRQLQSVLKIKDIKA